jgi:hypothetical protein
VTTITQDGSKISANSKYSTSECILKSFTFYHSNDGESEINDVDKWTEFLTAMNFYDWRATIVRNKKIDNGLALLRYNLIRTPRDGSNFTTHKSS